MAPTTTTLITARTMRTPGDTPQAVASVLFAWFSPAFPTGAFAWSHGLEAAELGGETELGDWLEDLLGRGSAWNDAVLLTLAWRAGCANDLCGLARVAELGVALCASREREAETLGQGAAFMAAVHEGWPSLTPPGGDVPAPYPAAAGWSAARLGAPVATAAAAFLMGFAANLVAAGVRLSLCGQTGGVRVLARLSPLIGELASRAARAGEDDLGGCAICADIAAMRHETLDGRLFLS